MNESRDPANAKLLSAAIDLFGRDGYDGASTRAIAAACDKPMSAITYHFGGKRGLYLAAAQYIADSLNERIKPTLDDAAELGSSDANPEQVEAALLRILNVCVAIVADDRLDSMAMFLLREQATPTEAFDIIYAAVMEPLLSRTTALLAAIARPGLDSEQARVLAMMLMGQVLMFRTCRAAAMRFTGWSKFGEVERAQLLQSARANLSRTLAGLRQGERT